MTIKTTSIMIIHIKRESDCGGNDRGYSEKQREKKGRGGGGGHKKCGIHFGSFFRESRERGGIKFSLRKNSKREREDIMFIYEGNT